MKHPRLMIYEAVVTMRTSDISDEFKDVRVQYATPNGHEAAIATAGILMKRGQQFVTNQMIGTSHTHGVDIDAGILFRYEDTLLRGLPARLHMLETSALQENSDYLTPYIHSRLANVIGALAQRNIVDPMYIQLFPFDR